MPLSEAACRQAALQAESGAVEEGATWPYLWPGGLRLAADLDQLVPLDDAAKVELVGGRPRLRPWPLGRSGGGYGFSAGAPGRW